MSYRILFDPESKEDIQDAISWYNQQKQGLGKEFYAVLKKDIERLIQNPFFEVRYDNVRCLPVQKFPFMIHFTIDESKRIVFIHAVFNTSLNPKKWKRG